MMKIKVFE